MIKGMEPLCDFCGIVRGRVYCKSDSARLCLKCDERVHSANHISHRHLRSLLCDKCFSQPANAHYTDNKINLCHSCEWNGNNGCIGSVDHRQSLNAYSGCPSLSEFSKIWGSILTPPSMIGWFDSDWSSGTTMGVNEDRMNNCFEARDIGGSYGLGTNMLNEFKPCLKLESLAGDPSSVAPPNLNILQYPGEQAPFFPEGLSISKQILKLESWAGDHSSVTPPDLNCLQYSREQAPFFPEEPSISKGKSQMKDLERHDNDGLCEGIDMDAVALDFNNNGDIFSCSQHPSNYNVQNALDCLQMEQSMRVTESDCDNAFKALSSGQLDSLRFQPSSSSATACMMPPITANVNRSLMNPYSPNTGLSFPSSQVHSGLLANITGENNGTDYQDCGISSAFFSGDSSWDTSLEGKSHPEARNLAMVRYNEKKKLRSFGKQIRYASRKARADTRKRIKGRFVKVGEEYDYDPSR